MANLGDPAKYTEPMAFQCGLRRGQAPPLGHDRDHQERRRHHRDLMRRWEGCLPRFMGRLLSRPFCFWGRWVAHRPGGWQVWRRGRLSVPLSSRVAVGGCGSGAGRRGWCRRVPLEHGAGGGRGFCAAARTATTASVASVASAARCGLNSPSARCPSFTPLRPATCQAVRWFDQACQKLQLFVGVVDGACRRQQPAIAGCGLGPEGLVIGPIGSPGSRCLPPGPRCRSSCRSSHAASWSGNTSA